MNYKLFEDKKSIKIMRREEEREDFNRIKKKLGFGEDIDLVTFCASIGLKKYIESNLRLDELPGSKKLADISTFDESKLFDYLIITCLNEKEKRLRKFESLFYTGFKILKKWFDENGVDIRKELEGFSDILDYVNKVKT